VLAVCFLGTELSLFVAYWLPPFRSSGLRASDVHKLFRACRLASAVRPEAAGKTLAADQAEYNGFLSS
jgi:hypothetical protein